MSADHYAWMASALCAQADPDSWTEGLAGGGSQTAKRICARCPVRAACTAHANRLDAYDTTELRGVWGGHTHNQRRQQLGEAA
ncbi:WhiB family transcriptional regulator [Streptomyces sp. NPDC058947]|uniref:WhiB family transcriptional regulator n=1 Tax=Streptomyces sp. NPDC058947 TaxID=3346675 RepID=UPI0036C36DC5